MTLLKKDDFVEEKGGVDEDYIGKYEEDGENDVDEDDQDEEEDFDEEIDEERSKSILH